MTYRQRFKLTSKGRPQKGDSGCPQNVNLMSNRGPLKLCTVVQRMSVKDRHIKFTLLAVTHSIDNFNASVKVAVLQEKQDWETP